MIKNKENNDYIIMNLITGFTKKVYKKLIKMYEIKKPVITKIVKKDFYQIQFNFNNHFCNLRFEKPSCISEIWTVQELKERAYTLKGVNAKKYYDFKTFNKALELIKLNYDKNIGINWKLVDEYLERYCKNDN